MHKPASGVLRTFPRGKFFSAAFLALSVLTYACLDHGTASGQRRGVRGRKNATKSANARNNSTGGGQNVRRSNVSSSAARSGKGGLKRHRTRRAEPGDTAPATTDEAADMIEAGDEAMARGSFTDAENLYKRAISRYPRSAEANAALGSLYLDMAQYGDSFPYFVKALQLDPGNVDAYYGIGHAYVNVDKPKDALSFLRGAIRLDSNHAEARYDLARAYLALGNKPAALKEYETLQRLDVNLATKLREELESGVRE
jgi:tetratricopeptide (TPR) repeat protein